MPHLQFKNSVTLRFPSYAKEGDILVYEHDETVIYGYTEGEWLKIAQSDGAVSLVENRVDENLKKGSCPKCGKIGRYINLAPVCPDHGVY